MRRIVIETKESFHCGNIGTKTRYMGLEHHVDYLYPQGIVVPTFDLSISVR
jgi:hypothetical protein